MRGNLGVRNVGCRRRRSIPARAGEPATRRTPGLPTRVYPRACGGTGHRLQRVGPPTGLSPRVRGNPVRGGDAPSIQGSIPARAGEPSTLPSLTMYSEVYPRACGGTMITRWVGTLYKGLSPRVRGNQRQPAGGHHPGRSIPARAGEPFGRRRIAGFDRVYPRACGGTGSQQPEHGPVGGLSPRVRGNLFRLQIGVIVIGSIPARAGEPPESTATGRPTRVYPRACGGTSST